MAAGSRLLGCTNSPETRLAGVRLRLDQEPISGCLCFPLLFYQDAVCYLSYFFSPLIQAPPSPCMCTHTSLCYLLWRFSSVSPGQKGSPLLALYAVELLMVFLMAADGCRQPLALGLGAQRSFNKSKSSPVPLHRYFWSITVKVRWRSLVRKPVLCERRRNIW